MALINTNVATLRHKCTTAGFNRLCEDYGLHPQFEDGATELRLTTEELADSGWQTTGETPQAALSC